MGNPFEGVGVLECWGVGVGWLGGCVCGRGLRSAPATVVSRVTRVLRPPWAHARRLQRPARDSTSADSHPTPRPQAGGVRTSDVVVDGRTGPRRHALHHAVRPAQCDLRVGDDASISTALGRPPPTALGSCSQKISRGPIELADACARADSEFGRLQAAGWPNFWRKGCGFGPRP